MAASGADAAVMPARGTRFAKQAPRLQPYLYGERRMTNLWRPVGVVLLAVAGLAALVPLSSRAGGGSTEPDPKDVQAVLDKAIAFLKSSQNADGSFSPKIAGPGVSALVAASLARNGISPRDPLLARTLAYLEKQVQKDGGIYSKGLANYTTSVALMAFREANRDGRYDTVIKDAARFLRKLQYGDNTDPKDPKFGGVGYDGGNRPDLSNTQFFVDALLAAGVPKNDPAVQKALQFISRCQNLPGETNDQPFAKKTTPADRGGFTYTPLDPDDSPHKTPSGGLRSLGGMTYGGLKSFLYAGVDREDPRVKAAVSWIRRHYTLEENPGMGQAGLYYYYHTFAKAMAALGEDRFTDAAGRPHDWRRELFEALRKRQRPDGSWTNATDQQFGERSPDLATAFAVLSLSYCRTAGKR
jgi:squalene-hopene/tetraprenyl-beta-curcumene cyclase